MVTALPPFSRELLGDPAIQNKKLGRDFASIRGDHLKDLSGVEAIVRDKAPLLASYDVNRGQSPYFHEFTYTECLGSGLLVSPQSTEASARLVRMALEYSDQGFDAASVIMQQREERGTLDKYKLASGDEVKVKAVAFVPGSNMFHSMVSREALMRAMWEDEELVIKPHPLTTDQLVGELCSIFGHYRVLDPKLSGDACLVAAERVYACTTTEMGLYAVLMGKPIRNVGDFFNEGRGAYSAFYRQLWNKSPEDAKATLTHILASPLSGFMHKDDPNVAERIGIYFDAAMAVRESLKPVLPYPQSQVPAAPVETKAQLRPGTGR